jgi:death-on-curing protein
VNDPEFLELEEVLLIHREQLARFGGGDGLRDQGLLESAIAMPRASFGGQFVHGSLFAMAGAYAFHIAENQPFLDGNKRTGVLAAVVFLELNGYIVEEPPSCLYDAMIAIAERRLDKAGLAALLERLSRAVGDEGAPRSS